MGFSFLITSVTIVLYFKKSDYFVFLNRFHVTVVYLLTMLLINNTGQYFWVENTFRTTMEIKFYLNLNNFIKPKFASILFQVSVN